MACIGADMKRYRCGTPAVATGGVPHLYRTSTAATPEEYRTYRSQSIANLWQISGESVRTKTKMK